MRVLMLAGLMVTASLACVAGGPSYPGTYKNESVTVEINEDHPGEFGGVIMAGSDVTEFSARRDGDALAGSYKAEGETTSFRMALQGARLTVSDGAESYVLLRQSTPGSAPPAAASASPRQPGHAAAPPPAVQQPLRINRIIVPEATVQSFEQVYGMHLPRGDYWYDRISGAWGQDGGPTAGFTTPGMNLGGPLPADASRGNTGVFINGRELPVPDVAAMMQMNIPVQQGHWWVDNSGNFGVEGTPYPTGNLFQYSRGRGGAYQRSTAGGYIGGDGNTSYFFDPKSGASVMTGN
jgi:hypothetical protein